MQYDFSQQKLFEKRRFRFKDDGLFIHSSTMGKTHEYEVKYENIGTKIITWKNGLSIYLLVAAFLTVVSVILHFDTSPPPVDLSMQIFIAVIVVVCVTLYFITYKKARYITNANNTHPIEIFSTIPNTEAVDNFIQEILSRRRAFLLERFGKLNRNLSYEPQYYNLIWLLDNAVIDQKEYDQKLAELNQMYPSTPVVKGFTINN